MNASDAVPIQVPRFIWRIVLPKKTDSTKNKNWNVLPGDTPPDKLVDLARAEVEKAKKKRAKKSTSGKSTKSTNKKTPVQSSTQVACDAKDCDYLGGSKSVVTRHWNKVHRKPHAQKRGTRRRNQDQGRPTILTPEVIAELVRAFKHGYTKTQAFRHAGISKDVYYDAIKKNEDFADEMRRAQDHLGLKARDVVAIAINAYDVKTAKWWLERKAKDEYSLRREATGPGGGPIKTKSAGAPEVTITKEELHAALFGDR